MLLGQGYAPERVLMVGDAPGDLIDIRIAILVRKEAGSWKELTETGLSLFLGGRYTCYGAEKRDAFFENLRGA